jgi:hypothetical protein
MPGPIAAERKSVTLTSEDLADLKRLRTTVEEREALNALIPASQEVTPTSSEAQLLHAVLVAGLRAVRETLADESYATDAADVRASDEERRNLARRRRPYWADEQ